MSCPPFGGPPGRSSDAVVVREVQATTPEVVAVCSVVLEVCGTGGEFAGLDLTGLELADSELAESDEHAVRSAPAAMTDIAGSTTPAIRPWPSAFI